MSNTLLQVHKVAKHFGQLKAVDGLSFAVSEGETLGIAGPNGAGKTTLFDVITGMTRATSGTVTFRGRAIQEAPIQEICHLGIARTFQLPTVFDTQTILANALVGAHFGKPKRLWTGLRRDPAIIHRAIQAVEFVGLGERLGDVAGPLPVFDKKRIMIASALATDPVMLFLDEPFGGLNPDETDRLIALFGEIKRLGVTLVLIEHVMRALVALSDQVLIMNQGRLLFQGDAHDIASDPEVARVYLGRAAATEVDYYRAGDQLSC